MTPDANAKPDVLTVRQRILKTATQLFHQQGYHSTGINQLIDEANVAKASLYQHFRTKDDILRAYLTQESQAWFELVNAILAQPLSAKEKVLNLFDLIRDFSLSVTFRGCHFQNAAIELGQADTETRQFIKAHKTRMAQVFTDILSNPEQAETVSLLFEGALISSQMYHSTDPIEQAKRVAERLL